MLTWSDQLVGLLVLLVAGGGAAMLGFRIGAIDGLGKRLLMLLGAMLLVIPVYTGLLFLMAPVSGAHAFAWWFIGLTWVGGPWCVIVGLGYFVGALQRRARR